MPYRRLPNTDSARLKAMKCALEKGQELPPNKMSYSQKNIVRLRKFLPHFEHSIQLQRLSVASQSIKSKDYIDAIWKARMYLTHFIRVMNMAVLRGDLPAETRAFFGLATNESVVPALNTENDLVSWGKRIIEGEEFRIKKGGSPITNPTIAVVRVRFEKFIETYNYHKSLIKKTLDYAERTNDMRKEADDLILQIWNEVEEKHSSLPEEIRKKESEEYGLVYFYRKTELKEAISHETQSTIMQNENLHETQDTMPPNASSQETQSIIMLNENLHETQDTMSPNASSQETQSIIMQNENSMETQNTMPSNTSSQETQSIIMLNENLHETQDTMPPNASLQETPSIIMLNENSMETQNNMLPNASLQETPSIIMLNENSMETQNNMLPNAGSQESQSIIVQNGKSGETQDNMLPNAGPQEPQSTILQ